ncbi:MAG TPA: hypothetical protein DIU39_06075 [Flavobacteriales bacterium]|nr:hypothetical protein [Flavobacteriales bacterium]
MKNSSGCILFILIALCGKTWAQDFHLSLPDAAPMYINPALTGQFDGKYRAHLQYRTQWNSLNIRPFTTALASFDMPVKSFAFGIQVMNNNAGTGYYNSLGILGSAAYRFSIDEPGFHNFAAAVQFGGLQKSVKEEELYFENQYNPLNGGYFDNNIPSAENLNAQNFWIPDVIVGFSYFYGKTAAKINPFIGYSVNHLNKPKESFYQTANTLPYRHIIHGGVKYNLNERFQFFGKGIMMKQVNNTQFNATLLAYYTIKDPGLILFAGPSFRNKDSFIFEIGGRFSAYQLRLSYDFNTSSLKTYTNGRGGFEIAFTYIPKLQKPNPIKSCPRL